MAAPYNHRAIEAKWRTNWEKKPVNVNDGKKPKYYCLDMFPYPSGSGLHVGHWRGYVISDVWSRYQLLKGKYVIHPMGWDAFGLPAENYAIKMGVHPAISTASNIKNIKRQINDIAAIYDWDMEVNTTDPEFYKWTQWIFVKMFKEGLAYEKEFPINWCPSCKTGLANEEVVNGKCERCGAEVTKKNLRQWMLRITKYADRLLNDLDKLDWPEKVKKMQTDWIGKSYGAEVDFPVEGREDKITVYTTRPDTLHGATFMVLAPEHKLAAELATPEHKEEVEKYIFDSSMKSNVDRLQDKEKTGVFTGTYAINPLNGAKVPIWLSDYVLADYGTGAIMCVPAHDDRDFEFATKFNIPIIQVIAKDGKEIENMTEAYTEASGTMINSGEWNGMESSVLKKEAPHIIEERGIGRATVNYKLRDWVFSRQRYWGEPIPIVHCPECGAVPVPEDQLPLRLPDVESYEPTGTGESPLAGIDEWVNTTCPVCGKPAKRETNTMPQWAGSSWYFLRYVDNHNNEELVSREKADAMLPVDMYIGGLMGCKGDAYTGEEALNLEEAIDFHSWQAGLFKSAKVDFLYAGIMPVLTEAIGMAVAMSDTDIPYIISFTIQRDGKLIDGHTIDDAIHCIDNHVSNKPVCYMTNCVHPDIVYEALSHKFNQTQTVKSRFWGIQANTSQLSYKELDGANHLHTSSAADLSEAILKLKSDCHLKIFGGCCGTDSSHMEKIAKISEVT